MTTEKLSGPQTKNPEWPFADAYDEVNAASESYIVRYEDDHLRLIEVGIAPGATTVVHGTPYASVLAKDAAQPNITETPLDPDSNLNGQGAQHAPSPEGHNYPTASTMAPLAPRTITNNDDFPLHLYKIEFKRIDGEDFKTKWKELYPWMLEPFTVLPNIDPTDTSLGPIVSEAYPYIAASESYIAAPNNHLVRYQDDHLVFLEVIFRPTERENIHGHIDNSVFAHDVTPGPETSGRVPFKPVPPNPPTNIPGFNEGGTSGDWKIAPDGMNGQGGGQATGPDGMQWPHTATMAQQWPHAAAAGNAWPAHFFRIQFKRLDGDDIKTKWREWYPWIAEQADKK